MVSVHPDNKDCDIGCADNDTTTHICVTARGVESQEVRMSA
jgi:hypothetical protein